MNGTLSDVERRALLDLARAEIAARLGVDVPAPPHAVFEVRAGAFVTIFVNGALRGCIGIPQRSSALGDVIRQCAQAAAFEDPRFPSLCLPELAALGVEISVLSEPRPSDGSDDIVIGRHGVIVERGWRRGLLLPQVAVEHGWTAPELLDHACRKAGLPPGAWREGATVSIFEAEVFGDRDGCGRT
jgi:AmmeMemoRadiSam system protein A